MGSDSDLSYLEDCISILKEFGVAPSVRVLSAHRTPDDLAQFARSAEEEGYQVIIAAAGAAAHLAGAVAAQTVLPVIGIPIPSSALSGMDALLATVQMPAGIPVSCMAIGKAGGSNAALFALEILGLADDAIREQLKDFRKAKADSVRKKDAKIQEKG
jgi:phosphoribosylaminoimidazole carboxylase PurE protein